MNAFSRAIVPFILLLISSTSCLAHQINTALTKEELNVALNGLHRQALLKAWAIFGDETLDHEGGCVTQRRIYIYSKPISISRNLVRSGLIMYLYEAEHLLSGQCGQLLKRSEEHMTAAKFIDSTRQNISTRISARELFKIQGNISDNQLVELGNVIAGVRECILLKNKCETLHLTIQLPKSTAYRLNSVSAENIESVLVRASPDNTGPIEVSFKPYPARELFMYVYNLGTKKQLVGITCAIP